MLKKTLIHYSNGSTSGTFYFNRVECWQISLCQTGAVVILNGNRILTCAVPQSSLDLVKQVLDFRNTRSVAYLPSNIYSSTTVCVQVAFCRWPNIETSAQFIEGKTVWTIDRQVSVSLETHSQSYIVTFPCPIHGSKESLVLSRTFSILDKRQYHLWGYPLSLLLPLGPLYAASQERSQETGSYIPIAMPKCNDSTSPSLAVNSHFNETDDPGPMACFWTEWGVVEALYLHETGLDDIVIEARMHKDRTLFRSSPDFGFLNMYCQSDNPEVFSVLNAPPIARNPISGEKYPLEDIISECLKMYQHAHSIVQKQPILVNPVFSSKLVHELDVDDVGLFRAYEDTRIRVMFQDRMLLHLPPRCEYGSNLATAEFVDPFGETVKVRLAKPIGLYKRYMKIGMDYGDWVFGNKPIVVNPSDSIAQTLERNQAFLKTLEINST